MHCSSFPIFRRGKAISTTASVGSGDRSRQPQGLGPVVTGAWQTGVVTGSL